MTFPASPYIPLAVGFFGLGVGYFIWGGQALFRFPAPTPDTNRTSGLWGIWMPGFMQFLAGTYIWVGLTWWNVFGANKVLYMAALAFTAYGVHWFAMGQRRMVSASSAPDGWMAIPFTIISLLGVWAFILANDYPVAILFAILTLIYLTDIPANFTGSAMWERAHGLCQFVNGCWLMYLTWASVANIAFGMHWWL
jgi:hypothetical protein